MAVIEWFLVILSTQNVPQSTLERGRIELEAMKNRMNSSSYRTTILPILQTDNLFPKKGELSITAKRL
ncbi:MAG: hypothetical protein ACR5K2_03150 [Wolbachia sp.]